MALSTGTQSLRGVGPRAPQFDQRDFRIDVESLGRAATLPARTAETIEDLGERSAERAIRRETRPARRTAAMATATGTAERAPIEQEILTGQARGAQQRLPAEQAVLAGQAQGAAERVSDEQEVLGRTAQRNVEDFDVESEAQREERLRRIHTAKRQAEQEAQQLAVLEATEAENLFAGREAAEANITQQQVAGMEANRRRMILEGTPETRLTETPEGQFAEDFVTTPTGEERVMGRKQTKTAQDVAFERDRINTARRAAEALATQREAAAARTNNRVAVRERTGQLGETLGFTVVTTGEDGSLISSENVDLGGARPGVSEMRESMPTPVAPQPVRENGRQFTPTGANVGVYRRGIVYTHPSLGRVIYTGGDPFNPESYQPAE